MPITYRPIQTSGLSLKEKVLIALWALVEGTLFRWSPRRCRGWRRTLLSLFGAKLDKTVSIHNKVRIHCPWNLVMDEYASLGEGCWVYSLDRIHIGAYSCVSQHAWLVTGMHDISSPAFDLITKPVQIGTGCWLAAGAKIMPGVSVGDYAVVGCASVVVKDVESFDVVAGNPARFIKKREFKEVE